MAWLLREGEVLASLEIADRLRPRLKGLIGRNELDGAILLRPANQVHTFLMKFPIDVAFCGRDMTVVRTTSMKPHRIGRPTLKSKCVIEAPAGAFERWRLRPGDKLEVRE